VIEREQTYSRASATTPKNSAEQMQRSIVARLTEK
jgi:hypothetical protein